MKRNRKNKPTISAASLDNAAQPRLPFPGLLVATGLMLVAAAIAQHAMAIP